MTSRERSRARLLGALVIAAFMAACATVSVAPRDPTPFDLLGRALVSYRGGAVTANVRWEHAADRDEIWLMTPTGQTLAHIVDTPQGATLTRADRQQYRARSVEALTRQALGWALPLGLMQHWLRGAPAPGLAFESLDGKSAERPASFTQSGWRVVLSRQTAGDLAGRVRRLDLNDGANEIRFVVDTWRDTGAR